MGGGGYQTGLSTVRGSGWGKLSDWFEYIERSGWGRLSDWFEYSEREWVGEVIRLVGVSC